MKEFAFIRNNIDKWQRAEIIIDDAASQTPDVLADTYTDLTSDLALRKHITLILVLPFISTIWLQAFIIPFIVTNGRSGLA